MGFVLSDVAQVSADRVMDFYFFHLGLNWKGGLADTVRDNFFRLSSELGPDSAIVVPADNVKTEHWGEQLTKCYFGGGDDHFRRMVGNLIPCLFVTDASPDAVRPDTLRVFIPLNHVQQQFGSFDTLFDDLAILARHRDIRLFGRLREVDSFDDWRDALLEVVELKPNLMGLGVNINAVVKRLIGKRRSG